MPDWKPEIRGRLQSSRLTPAREADIIEELAQYLNDYYAESVSSGKTEAEAYQQTLTELSGSELLARELRGAERQYKPVPVIFGADKMSDMIAGLLQDLRFSARTLSLEETPTCRTGNQKSDGG